jgi:hypothetical protein
VFDRTRVLIVAVRRRFNRDHSRRFWSRHPARFRRFHLVRNVDESGVSGTGVVAEGVLFSNGVVAVQWTSQWPTSVVFHERGLESVIAVHGHNGHTHVHWIDPDPDDG